MSTVNGDFNTPDEWYAALIKLAQGLMVGNLVSDREAWIEGWAYQTPEQAFFAEYPEYAED